MPSRSISSAATSLLTTAAACIATACIAACAGTQPLPAAGPSGGASTLEAERPAGPSPAPAPTPDPLGTEAGPAGGDGVRRPDPGDGAPAAGSSRAADAPSTPLEDEALARVQASMGGARPPARSERLSRAARDLALRAAAGEPAPLGAASLRRALADAGAFDPAPAGVLLATHPRDVAGALARAARLRGVSHLGVGVVVRDGTAWAVLLAAERRAEIEPLPRRVDPGSRLSLGGRLVGLSDARVFVAAPAGWAREVPVRGDGTRFAAELRFDEPGRWRVEVMGVGPGGPAVAAILDVDAGAAPSSPPPTPSRSPSMSPLMPPATPPPAKAAPPTAPDRSADAGGDEAQVLAAIDSLRARQGLAPLRPDARLAEQARRHSAAMLAAGTVAHVLRGGPDVAARLRLAGVPFRVARENVARGEGTRDAQRAIEDSPAHLANLLSPQVRDVGVGLVRGELPGGQPVAYLTQVLVEPIDDGDWRSLTPEGRAKEAIATERARRGLTPLQADAALDGLARETAREMLGRGEPGPGDLAARALALRPSPRGRTGNELAAADAFVAGSPADAARSRNAGDPRFHRLGVGVVKGDSPRFGAGLYWMAVVYAE